MVLDTWSAAEIFLILGYFFALLPPNNPENKDFDKIKKTPADIIILHMCTISENHDYGS